MSFLDRTGPLIPKGTKIRLVMPDYAAPPPPPPPEKPGHGIVYSPSMRAYFYWPLDSKGMPQQPKQECPLCAAGIPRRRMTRDDCPS
jgi:hypothetical protein